MNNSIKLKFPILSIEKNKSYWLKYSCNFVITIKFNLLLHFVLPINHLRKLLQESNTNRLEWFQMDTIYQWICSICNFRFTSKVHHFTINFFLHQSLKKNYIIILILWKNFCGNFYWYEIIDRILFVLLIFNWNTNIIVSKVFSNP